MKKLLFVLLSGSLFASCANEASKEAATPSFNMDSVKAAIDANNAALISSMKANDSATFVNLYTKDGCIMADNAPKLCGPAGLAQFLAGSQQLGMTDLKLTVTEIIGDNTLVSEEGTYEMFGKGGVSMDKGKYIVTWKKEDGVWKKYRDIFNSDLPAPVPPPLKK